MLRRTEQEYQQSSGTLRQLRFLAGWSQRRLASEAGVAPNTIAACERGHIPRPATQKRIAEALSAGVDREVDRFELWPMIEGIAA